MENRVEEPADLCSRSVQGNEGGFGLVLELVVDGPDPGCALGHHTGLAAIGG